MKHAPVRPVARASKRAGVVAFLGATIIAGPLSAQTVTVNNSLANGYANDPLPGNCPNGPTITGIPSGFWIERPHWNYQAKQSRWVLWAHYESSGYGTAQALVATSASECGPYTIVKTFRPLGYEVRDDFFYADDDGTGYFIAASNKTGGANDTLAIFRMTSDWLDVDSSAGVHWVLQGAYREAPVIMKKDGVYFLLTSAAAGWYPSQGGYVTSTSMLGTWSAFANLGNSSTFGGQNAGAQIFKGSSSTAYVLRMDHLGGSDARDDGWILLPVLLDSTAKTASLNWYSTWSLNKTTGALTLPSTTGIAINRPATASATGSGSSPANADDRDYTTQWAATGSGDWPAYWSVDLGSAKHIGEVQISWPMVKGSEAYYQYKLEYSTDGNSWSVIDRTASKLYGFTIDKPNVTARYLRVRLVNAVLSNNPNNWYTPALYDVRVLP